MDGKGALTWLSEHTPTQKIINRERLIRKMIMNNWQQVLEVMEGRWEGRRSRSDRHNGKWQKEEKGRESNRKK